MDDVTLRTVEELVQLLSGTPIVELQLDDGDLHVSLRRSPPVASSPGSGVEHLPPPLDDDLAYVSAPLLGVFYRSPSPGAPPFVHVGDQVEIGQVIGLIEAMKIFNEIQAEVSGKVRAVLAEDGAFVEADQRLIAIDTQASEEQSA